MVTGGCLYLDEHKDACRCPHSQISSVLKIYISHLESECLKHLVFILALNSNYHLTELPAVSVDQS